MSMNINNFVLTEEDLIISFSEKTDTTCFLSMKKANLIDEKIERTNSGNIGPTDISFTEQELTNLYSDELKSIFSVSNYNFVYQRFEQEYAGSNLSFFDQISSFFYPTIFNADSNWVILNGVKVFNMDINIKLSDVQSFLETSFTSLNNKLFPKTNNSNPYTLPSPDISNLLLSQINEMEIFTNIIHSKNSYNSVEFWKDWVISGKPSITEPSYSSKYITLAVDSSGVLVLDSTNTDNLAVISTLNNYTNFTLPNEAYKLTLINLSTITDSYNTKYYNSFFCFLSTNEELQNNISSLSNKLYLELEFKNLSLMTFAGEILSSQSSISNIPISEAFNDTYPMPTNTNLSSYNQDLFNFEYQNSLKPFYSYTVNRLFNSSLNVINIPANNYKENYQFGVNYITLDNNNNPEWNSLTDNYNNNGLIFNDKTFNNDLTEFTLYLPPFNSVPIDIPESEYIKLPIIGCNITINYIYLFIDNFVILKNSIDDPNILFNSSNLNITGDNKNYRLQNIIKISRESYLAHEILRNPSINNIIDNFGVATVYLDLYLVNKFELPVNINKLNSKEILYNYEDAYFDNVEDGLVSIYFKTKGIYNDFTNIVNPISTYDQYMSNSYLSLKLPILVLGNGPNPSPYLKDSKNIILRDFNFNSTTPNIPNNISLVNFTQGILKSTLINNDVKFSIIVNIYKETTYQTLLTSFEVNMKSLLWNMCFFNIDFSFINITSANFTSNVFNFKDLKYLSTKNIFEWGITILDWFPNSGLDLLGIPNYFHSSSNMGYLNNINLLKNNSTSSNENSFSPVTSQFNFTDYSTNVNNIDVSCPPLALYNGYISSNYYDYSRNDSFWQKSSDEITNNFNNILLFKESNHKIIHNLQKTTHLKSIKMSGGNGGNRFYNSSQSLINHLIGTILYASKNAMLIQNDDTGTLTPIAFKSWNNYVKDYTRYIQWDLLSFMSPKQYNMILMFDENKSVYPNWRTNGDIVYNNASIDIGEAKGTSKNNLNLSFPILLGNSPIVLNITVKSGNTIFGGEIYSQNWSWLQNSNNYYQTPIFQQLNNLYNLGLGSKGYKSLYNYKVNVICNQSLGKTIINSGNYCEEGNNYVDYIWNNIFGWLVRKELSQTMLNASEKFYNTSTPDKYQTINLFFAQYISKLNKYEFPYIFPENFISNSYSKNYIFNKFINAHLTKNFYGLDAKVMSNQNYYQKIPVEKSEYLIIMQKSFFNFLSKKTYDILDTEIETKINEELNKTISLTINEFSLQASELLSTFARAADVERAEFDIFSLLTSAILKFSTANSILATSNILADSSVDDLFKIYKKQLSPYNFTNTNDKNNVLAFKKIINNTESLNKNTSNKNYSGSLNRLYKLKANKSYK